MIVTILVDPSFIIFTIYTNFVLSMPARREEDFFEEIMHLHYVTDIATP